jgi:hypothetical protein
MKHIRLFEDYSDEEISSMRDDLDKVGLDDRFEFGKDFGFGEGFKEKEGRGYFLPRISTEILNLLVKRGEIIQKGPDEYKFKSPSKWGFTQDTRNEKIVRLAPEEWAFKFQIGSTDKDNLYDEISNDIMEEIKKIRK